ncbi:MAG TPA: hypothetical protein VM680_19180 [Verrucomicrobiae bacterium]|nr:hypothetical protein [Verrucomicrobiae bacterium]
MKEEPLKAWQPLTFGGVARYGHDWVGKLFFACLVISILTASVVVWTATRTWLPVIEDAITRLPQGAEIRGGKLTAPQPVQLAENPFLALRLDPLGEATPPSLADMYVILAPREIQFRSLFGMAKLPYRPEWTVELSRADWEPRWAAWRPAVLAYLFFGTVVMLFSTWIAFGIAYAIPVRIFAAILKRSVSLWGSWKLSVAGLLPAAILMTIAAYGLGQIRIPHLIGAWALHFVIGWIFIIAATIRLPERRHESNPFDTTPKDETTDDDEAVPNPFKGTEPGNPFRRPRK